MIAPGKLDTNPHRCLCRFLRHTHALKSYDIASSQAFNGLFVFSCHGEPSCCYWRRWPSRSESLVHQYIMSGLQTDEILYNEESFAVFECGASNAFLMCFESWCEFTQISCLTLLLRLNGILLNMLLKINLLLYTTSVRLCKIIGCISQFQC